MGKAQKKTGKGRLDKYYKLAKEQGYRARSAFKLIQLNKKYSFLEGARCCIDLCAAPGGWLQVASKYMPVNSVIVGIDLVPIKPIPRVVTFAADITTPQCRNLIRGELKDWKADVVLHDGAPNVGTAWVQDAYSQSELVLMSMKLAAEFLTKGGTFVTKVFRSVDYNNLLWVFNQLFGKVEATKPPSSRNVSAEIFVVCRDYLAPKHIDPKFFDPKHVFKDLSANVPIEDLTKQTAAQAQVNVFQPEKRRRKRDGYAEGDYILFKQAGAAEFIHGQDPVAFLGTMNKITFETEEEKEWLALDITTSDVKLNCDDLKVLGRGDFKALIKWRTALREELGLEVKTKDAEEITETAEITEDAVDPEQEIEEELARLNAEAAARTKRERRRANEAKQRTIQRMQLQMTAPLDIGLEQQDQSLRLGQDDVFDLEHSQRELKRKGGMERLMDEAADDESDEEEDRADEDEDEEMLDEEEERERKVKALEDDLDGLYESYQERMREKDAKYRVKEARRKDKSREEWGGIQKKDSDEEDESDGEDGGWDNVQAVRARAGEDSDSSDDDDESEVEAPQPSKKRRRAEEVVDLTKGVKKARSNGSVNLDGNAAANLSRSAQVWFSQDFFKSAGIDDVEDDDDEDDDMEDVEEEADIAMGGASGSESPSVAEEVETDDDGDDFEIVPLAADGGDFDMWDVEDENEDEIKQEKIKKHGLTTAEAVTLATQLVNGEKTRTELINEGFNRYSLNSKDDLPTWFLDDESKHYKANIPVTKEAVAALRAKMRALDARPIKKVAEAKARKKMKAAQKLEKAMKKAEGVNETSDMTEREKAKQIEKLMAKGMSTKKKQKELKVVVAKGAHKGLKGRPKGVKGRYVMVDSRMKKEVRAQKRRDKASKKRK
ncbi:Spb1 C-terminal domain-containing protein [Cytidiella melzeri]|nr:Spb1 C-terminal domain-containing protein [Cytidiella melzeri]